MGVRRSAIDETLRQHGVGADVLAQARTLAERQGISFRQAVGRVQGADPVAVARALSELSGLPLVEEIPDEHLEPENVRDLPMSMARESGLLPLYEVDGQVVVGITDLAAMQTLGDLRVLLDRPLRPVLVPSTVLQDAINRTYDKASRNVTDVLDAVEDDEGVGQQDDLLLDDADLLDDPNEAPIIRFVNALLTQAVKQRASDIHIEPFEKTLKVRFRIDGVLYSEIEPPFRFKSSIVSRIKIMAGLNIAEKRLPQDGRIRRRMGGREIDLRVSTVPVRHGERVVMRILEKGEVFSLTGIGMASELLETFRSLIRKPHGILLVSGPTGSGKSTTLYSAISEINEPDKNILTIEDPVEYELKGIGQVQVNPKIDLTFASALRSFLRQDPDVILVGEIRDSVTAANAVQASLTGHLVFSTIHTNDAAGAFARLVDMGVEPFLVASSLLGVLAQRLVRRLCPTCKVAHEPTDAELRDIGVRRADIAGRGIFTAAGCKECNDHGYRGRVGIFEFMPATDGLKNLVIANADAGVIKRKAVEGGMKTLRDDGVRLVLDGVTTFDEVLRVTREDVVEV